MAINAANLHIVHYPTPVLRQRAKPLLSVTDEVRAVATRMVVLMHEADGIGLAAPQVGLSWRMFVIEIPESEGDEDSEPRSATERDGIPPSATRGPEVFINPTLSHPEGKTCPMEEGCLSLPEIRGDVLRPEIITVTYLDAQGASKTLRAGGLLARCIQHEFDHLEGTLILDRMTQSARLKARQKIKALEQNA